MKEFIERKIKEFYTTLTDQIDEENGYYDSQFASTQPYEVEGFIRKALEEAFQMKEKEETE